MPPDGKDEFENVVFEPEPAPPAQEISPTASNEYRKFAEPAVPNSAHIPLWRDGYIKFNPENSVSVFALLSLTLVLVACILLTFLGIWVGNTTWMDRIFTALGHAATAIVGAIVGSSVAGKKKSK